MRNFLKILGIFCLIVVVIGGGAFAVLAYEGHHYDVESKAFVDTAMPIIAADWEPQELINRAAPELFGSNPAGEGDLFKNLGTLGPMQRYDGSAGAANIDFENGHFVITAAYTARGDFPVGEVSFDLYLVKLNGIWQIAGFHVDAP